MTTSNLGINAKRAKQVMDALRANEFSVLASFGQSASVVSRHNRLQTIKRKIEARTGRTIAELCVLAEVREQFTLCVLAKIQNS